jgi:DNA-binding GntR family transcriptional regulator
VQATITARLTELLRDDIVSGRLPSGSRVTVADVAARYGVGQMPVREALQRLQGERIIVLLPNKGARVLSLDEQFVNNMYDLRGAIESLLMRLAVPNLTNAIMARLATICGEIDKAARAGDVTLVRALNGEFHRLVYRHADNPVALEIYDRYASLMGTLREKYGISPARLPVITQGLFDVMEAIRAQEAEEAGRLVSLHCSQAKKDLLDLMANARKEHGPGVPESADPHPSRTLTANPGGTGMIAR